VADGRRLTTREREVAQLVASGATDATIAYTLGLSVRTVHAHVRSILAKLCVRRRSDVGARLP
jgi:DNA-binding NarL/FixJ family response regulator